MLSKLRTHKFSPALLLALLLSLLVFTVAYAANIDTSDKWAWGTNVGWLNFAPTHGGGVTVYTNHLEGYVWAENIGWIRLNSDDTTGGNPYYANTTASNYGVNYNNSTGELSGYAWGTNVGWIDFNPTHGGVTINTTTGDFDGYAWSENVGWINFSGTATDMTSYKVQTTTPTAIRLSNFTSRAGINLAAQMVIPLGLVSVAVTGSIVSLVRRRKKA